jgi:phage shock protein A
VEKGHDDMARAALERALSHDELVKGFAAQAEDQKHEADELRQALHKLDQKLSETRAHCEMLVAEHRRAKVVGRATQARQAVGANQDNAMDRLKSRVRVKSAENAAASEVLLADTLEDRFQALESKDKVEVLLNEIKSRQAVE